jgi:D-sedoheptulose 7-phosphate isomerase
MTSEVSWQDWLERSRRLLDETAATMPAEQIACAVEVIAEALMADRPLLICGNGGSAADSLHLSAELVGRFKRNRRPYRVMSLAADPVFMTAWGNDVSFQDIFARQVRAHGAEGGVLLGLTTSGRSENVLAAFDAARSRRMQTIALTGAGGAALQGRVDHLLVVPSDETALVQQIHLMLYHHWCHVLEARLA